MNLFLIIGHTGQGKTTLVKRLIKNRKAFIFDVNNEYQGFSNRDTALNIKGFTERVSLLTGFNIVYEDATGFLRGKQSAEFMRQIVRKRHTRNNFFILFHSINRIPPELMELANFIILFKTNDNAEIVDKKFRNEKLLKAFYKVKTNPDFKPVIIKTI